MTKEINHQTAQAHAKDLYTPLNSQGSNVNGHTVPYGCRKHCKLVEHFKARRFGIKNKLKPIPKAFD
jgi:hypothetical protein